MAGMDWMDWMDGMDGVEVMDGMDDDWESPANVAGGVDAAFGGGIKPGSSWLTGIAATQSA